MFSKSYCFLQVYQQNSNLKAEVAKLKSSEKTLLNKLEKSKEKYDRLSQCFENSCSKAEQIMDQLEETKSYFEILPFLKKFIKVFVIYVNIYIHFKRGIAMGIKKVWKLDG